MPTSRCKSIDLGSIDLAPVVKAAEEFLDEECDFAEIPRLEKSGPSRVLMSLHANAVVKLYALRRRLTEAGLYDLSRLPDRAGAYDGPILRMHGAADGRRLEVCTPADYLRAGVAALWEQVRPFFREQGTEFEFAIDADQVKRFRFSDASVARVEMATHRLRAAIGLRPNSSSDGRGDIPSDNPKNPRKRGSRGPYKAARNAEIVRKVEDKVREGYSREQAFEEIGRELSEKAATIRRAYYRAQRGQRKTRQKRGRSQ